MAYLAVACRLTIFLRRNNDFVMYRNVIFIEFGSYLNEIFVARTFKYKHRENGATLCEINSYSTAALLT